MVDEQDSVIVTDNEYPRHRDRVLEAYERAALAHPNPAMRSRYRNITQLIYMIRHATIWRTK